jgi:hypothetical protein
MPPGRVDEATKAMINHANADLSKEYHALRAFKLKKGGKLKLHIAQAILIMKGICPIGIRQKISQIGIECPTARQDLQFQFTETRKMLIRDHGPQGDRTTVDWENSLDRLTMERGVDTAIATFKECFINMERSFCYNPDGTPAASSDVTV